MVYVPNSAMSGGASWNRTSDRRKSRYGGYVSNWEPIDWSKQGYATPGTLDEMLARFGNENWFNAKAPVTQTMGQGSMATTRTVSDPSGRFDWLYSLYGMTPKTTYSSRAGAVQGYRPTGKHLMGSDTISTMPGLSRESVKGQIGAFNKQATDYYAGLGGGVGGGGSTGTGSVPNPTYSEWASRRADAVRNAKAQATQGQLGGQNAQTTFDRLMADWDAKNPTPYASIQRGRNVQSSRGGTEPTTAPSAPEYTSDLMANAVVGAGDLYNAYAQIANQGKYTPEEIEAILGQVERGEDVVLQGLAPYKAEQLGLYKTGMEAALTDIARQAAEGRRRAAATTAAGLGGRLSNQPGLMASVLAGTAAPVTAAQTTASAGARETALGQEQGLNEQLWNIINQITSQRGARRSGLLEESLAAKTATGLPGVASAIGLQNALATGQGWNQALPESRELGLSTAKANVANNIWENQAAIGQLYNQMNTIQQQQFQKELEEFQYELAEKYGPSFAEQVIGGLLGGLGSAVPGWLS